MPPYQPRASFDCACAAPAASVSARAAASVVVFMSASFSISQMAHAKDANARVNRGGRQVKTSKSLARELVADAAHGMDERRAVAELLPDGAHVRVDGAVESCERPPERELAEAALAHDAAGVARQHFEHVELGERQLKGPAAPLGAADGGRD